MVDLTTFFLVLSSIAIITGAWLFVNVRHDKKRQKDWEDVCNFRIKENK